MSFELGKRRFRRLPLSIAIASVVSLGGFSGSAFALEQLQEDTKAVECKEDDFSCSASETGKVRGGEWSEGQAGIAIHSIAARAAKAASADSTAIGNGATVKGTQPKAHAIGENTRVHEGNIAIGANSQAWNPDVGDEPGGLIGNGSVALGAGSVVTEADTIGFGNRRLVNVQQSQHDTDAAIMQQYRQINEHLGAQLDENGNVVGMGFTGELENQTVWSAINNLGRLELENVAPLEAGLTNASKGMHRLSDDGSTLSFSGKLSADTVDFADGKGNARKIINIAGADIEDKNSTDLANMANHNAVKQLLADRGNTLHDVSAAYGKKNLLGSNDQNTLIGYFAAGTELNIAGSQGERKLTGVDISLDDEGHLSKDGLVNGATVYQMRQTLKDVAEGLENLTELRDGTAAMLPTEADFHPLAVERQGDGFTLALEGKDGTVIDNLLGGKLDAGSRQGINGSQLNNYTVEMNELVAQLEARVEQLLADWPSTEAPTTLDIAGTPRIADMAGQPLNNVGKGIADTDGVNVGQVSELIADAVEQARTHTDQAVNGVNSAMQQFRNENEQRFRQMDDRLDRIGAMNAASTHMAINAAGAKAGHGRAAFGVGVQSDKKALSLGYARAIGERTQVSVGGAFSGPERSAGVGVSVRL